MAGRRLTEGEWAALSAGLASALRKASVEPRIIAHAHPAAYVAALWRGGRPIMAVGRTIWWPAAAPDFAGSGTMSVLQHELQHILDYAQSALSAVGYLVQPRHWTYRYDLSRPLQWDGLGAEQRASLAEDYWIAQHRGDAKAAQALGLIIPWANDGDQADSSPAYFL
jgi:hypothetical protein